MWGMGLTVPKSFALIADKNLSLCEDLFKRMTREVRLVRVKKAEKRTFVLLISSHVARVL